MLSETYSPVSHKTYELRKISKKELFLTFLTVFEGRDQYIEDSILSINRIAQEVGEPFEIVVINTTKFPIHSDSIAGINDIVENFRICDRPGMSRGLAKNLTFLELRGSHIIMFDSEMEYGIEYADLIFSYLRFREKRVLFSELSIIPREMIEEAGAWRNLKVSEDIDLYARISMNGPITHYPTKIMKNRRDGLIFHNLDLEKKPGFSRLSWKKKTSLIRDLILGCNYSLKDIMALNGYPFQKIGKKRFLLLLSGYIHARFSRERGDGDRRNNYLVFMETMFESIVLSEYKKFESFGKDIRIRLTRTEKSYLYRRSELWKKVNRSLRSFLVEDDSEIFL
ncbi:MAG: glycosyltransferase family 2 protein [Thermoplasmataceae archaeon]